MDLFGNDDIEPPKKRKRRATRPNGYAANPGGGPRGKTCRSCKHKVRRDRYLKCALSAPNWTNGTGSDILARSPACGLYEET